MDLSSLTPLAPYAALVIAVNLGGFLAKPLWAAFAASSWRMLKAVGRGMGLTMRCHPAIVGALLGALPWLLPGPVVERVAIGLVLGEFAETLYTDGRAALRRRFGGVV